MKLGEALYKAQQEEAAAGESAPAADNDADSSASGSKNGDDAKVVDADYEEVSDEDEPKKKSG